MVEKKIEEMKQNLDPTLGLSKSNPGVEHPCTIDLDLEVSLPDKLFATSLDKINFYREVEIIDNLQDIKIISQDFMDNPSISTLNFF